MNELQYNKQAKSVRIRPPGRPEAVSSRNRQWRVAVSEMEKETLKKGYQPVSRILFPVHDTGRSSFIWPLHYFRDLAAYPSR